MCFAGAPAISMASRRWLASMMLGTPASISSNSAVGWATRSAGKGSLLNVRRLRSVAAFNVDDYAARLNSMPFARAVWRRPIRAYLRQFAPRLERRCALHSSQTTLRHDGPSFPRQPDPPPASVLRSR